MEISWQLRSLLGMAIICMGLLQPPGSAVVANGKDSEGWEEEVLSVVEATSQSTTGTLCVTEPYRAVPASVHPERFDLARQKVDLLATFLRDLPDLKSRELVRALMKSLMHTDSSIEAARLIILNTSTVLPNYSATASLGGAHVQEGLPPNPEVLRRMPWYDDPHSPPPSPWFSVKEGDSLEDTELPTTRFMPNRANHSFRGMWTFPYYACDGRKWIMSYSVNMHLGSTANSRGGANSVLSIDVDLSKLDINQCDFNASAADNDSTSLSFMRTFAGTHKCHKDTSVCVFRPGSGWSRGSYDCHCRAGFYGYKAQTVFNGSAVEVAWRDKIMRNDSTYDILYECRACAPGCHNCTDDTPCLSPYNWGFRNTLLVFTVLCILMTVTLIVGTYRYRRIKVIKVASPIFLSITLIGCIIMYCEMATIFPVLDSYKCIATKWTRHMGFCITYTALLMKTWRVSLTYRVKSAHKLKLTDKQLLQWMLPIVLVMVIYLGSWTLGSPPQAEYITDGNGLFFKQCTYDWWDHSLAIGEVIFLLWGIKVCYNVRNAESFFDEAKHISWAIYNIAIVNTFMVAMHLFIFPHAGPDIKYLLGFMRTQLSTTVTIGVVFGPKFYRVIKGLGDQYDNRARARGVTASFSLNGIGLVNEDAPDLFLENEELKEELQKLAAQIEFMKIVHMEMNNRHLKPKVGSYFNQMNAMTCGSGPGNLSSPLGRGGVPTVPGTYLNKFDSSDTPSARLSPAAELISERV